MTATTVRSRYASIAGLAVALGLSLGTGFVGSLATSTSVATWYPALEKPAWTPPGWLFGPVWTLLYVMMGIAAWLVWRQVNAGRATLPLLLFALQLLLNAGWSLLFFGLRSPGLALIEILLLWIAIAATLWAFARVQRRAALLLAPYLAWVSFAAALNLEIWRINP
jgi:tryptophan-rich sensory protein